MIERREISRISHPGAGTLVGRPVGPVAGAPGGLPGSDDLLRAMWRSRWLVLLSVVLTMVAGFIYIQTATPIYQSTSQLYVQQDVQPFPQLGRPERYNLYTQAALLSSTRILAAALRAPEFEDMQTLAGSDNPLAYLEKNIQVTVGKNDDTISISLCSPYPIEAAEIVNGIVNAFMTDHEEHKRKTSAEVLESLQRQRDQTEQNLKAKREESARMKKADPLLAMELDQGGVVTQEFQQLSVALAEARLNTITATTLHEGVKNRANDPADLRAYLSLPGTLGPPDISTAQRNSLEGRLFDLELNLQSLLSRDLTGDHPQVRTMREEIARIREVLAQQNDQFVQTQLAAAEQYFLDAKKKEEEIARLFDEKHQQALTLRDQLVDYQLLGAEIEELTEYRRTLEQQIREIAAREDLEPETKIRVLEVARPAGSPSEPQPRKAMGVALVMGLLLGGGLAMVRNWLDQTLRSADEISMMFGLPVLGVVPAMSRRDEMPVRGRMVFLRPDSQEAEAFRTVRTAVFFGAPREKAKTILITSPAAGDGKSTLVSNLAIAIASAGQKTIIVDADFRRPMQQVVFSTNHHEQCLNSVFAGRMRLAEAIQPTEVKGLSLLTCGPGFLNPAEIINSRQFAKLLQCLGRAYDRVLVDAPPVTVVTDAQILGAICDFSILVLKADKSTRKIAQRAIDALQGVGAHLLGVVVNEVRRDGSRYGYYGGYHGSNGARPARGGGAKAPHTPIGTNGRRSVTALIAPNNRNDAKDCG